MRMNREWGMNCTSLGEYNPGRGAMPNGTGSVQILWPGNTNQPALSALLAGLRDRQMQERNAEFHRCASDINYDRTGTKYRQIHESVSR